MNVIEQKSNNILAPKKKNSVALVPVSSPIPSVSPGGKYLGLFLDNMPIVLLLENYCLLHNSL